MEVIKGVIEMYDYEKMKKEYNNNGYIVFDVGLSDTFLDELINDMDRINASSHGKYNPKYYHYNDYPRLIEGWRNSKNIKRLALDKNIKNVLENLYGEKPLAFSTINFTKGTEQPLHSDYFHFGSIPELMLAGVWVALEDISPDSGPLSVVPKSHKFPVIYPEDLGLKIPTSSKKIKENYTVYENYITKTINDKKLEISTPSLKKGQALIWAANMLHGAFNIKDHSITRYSQVTHYHFTGCEFYYNPTFSSREKYNYRDISESLIEN